MKALLDDGYGVRKIGRTLNIPHSTVSRELARNTYGGDERTPVSKRGIYDPAAAHHKAYVRRQYACYQGKKIQEDDILREFIIASLKRHWNPDEIAGFMKRHKACKRTCQADCTRGIYASKTAIYEWLRSEWGQQYCEHLYSRRKRVKHQKPKAAKRKPIPERVGISDRPRGANNRTRYGHWEKDAIVSSKRSNSSAALSVDQERVSRYVFATVVASMRPSEHVKTTHRLVEERRAKIISITYDNGIENRDHVKLSCMGIGTYFTDPYSSWQKGGVENANKMLRRYFPKGTDFATVTQTEVDAALRLINEKPRKILGYRSSLQVATMKGVIGQGGALGG